MLSFLPPEMAHNIGVWLMRHQFRAPGPFICNVPTRLFGCMLFNPLGLAAGFDKNGHLVDASRRYGFGFIEVGSVTLGGGKGNPKPRMFRVPKSEDIMNRMGLNGDPAERVAERLMGPTWNHFGVSIAKTNDPEIVGDAAILDMALTYQIFRNSGFYTCLNISCPNTKDQTFCDTDPLRELLCAIKERIDSISLPIAVKLPPFSLEKLERIIDVCEVSGIVKGYVCFNTVFTSHLKFGTGGQSGHAVLRHALNTFPIIRRWLPKTELIACGGIFNSAILSSYLEMGANAFQAYNGFVRGPCSGPSFAHDVLSETYEGGKP